MTKNYLAEIEKLIEEKFKGDKKEIQRVLAINKQLYNNANDTSKDPNATNRLLEELKSDSPDVLIVKACIGAGAEFEVRDKDGYSSLDYVAKYNLLELAKLILLNGGNVHIKDNFNWTPLHTASLYNSFEVAMVLLRYGADANAKNKYDSTPYSIAEELKFDKLVQLFKSFK